MGEKNGLVGDAYQTVYRLTAVRLVLRSTSAALPTVNSHIICDCLQIVNGNRHIVFVLSTDGVQCTPYRLDSCFRRNDRLQTVIYLSAACAAASLAIGTLNGEHET